MTKTITLNNLVRFVYRETTAEEASLIEEALRSDWELREIYEQILSAKAELEKAGVSPRQRVVDRILNYSRNTAPMEHLQ